jgi:hypothetical protein
MRVTAPPDSVPVRSVTRAVSAGTATSACAVCAASAMSTMSATLNRRMGVTRQGLAGAAKSTVGGLAITASFSTAKFGFGL